MIQSLGFVPVEANFIIPASAEEINEKANQLSNTCVKTGKQLRWQEKVFGNSTVMKVEKHFFS